MSVTIDDPLESQTAWQDGSDHFEPQANLADLAKAALLLGDLKRSVGPKAIECRTVELEVVCFNLLPAVCRLHEHPDFHFLESNCGSHV